MRAAFLFGPALALTACATTAEYEGTWRIDTECQATQTRPAVSYIGTAEMYQNSDFEYVGDYENLRGDIGTVLAKVDGNKILGVVRFTSGGSTRATLTRVPGTDVFKTEDAGGCSITARLSG